MKDSITAQRLAFVALAGVAYYVLAVVVLAILHPDMNPLERSISEYQKGRYPFLAATTFFALATAVAALNLGLRKVLTRSWVRTLGLALIWTAVAGIVIAGVFPDAPMHAVAFLMTFPSLSVAAVVLSLALARADGWEKFGVPLLILALANAAILLFGLPVLSGRGLGGLWQRSYFVALFGWMTIIAWRIMKTISPERRE